jgi:hypothetical protein
MPRNREEIKPSWKKRKVYREGAKIVREKSRKAARRERKSRGQEAKIVPGKERRRHGKVVKILFEESEPHFSSLMIHDTFLPPFINLQLAEAASI